MSKTPSHIARYTVVQPIAAGGMGEVFLARDERLDRLVAIKLLRDGFDNDELRGRFEEEARNVARLTHPNIVTIYEYGAHDGRPYIAMEYVAGRSMADIIRRQLPLPLARRIRLVEELCSGLGHAHKAHLVHRDVKPANLMVATSGMLKVLDFGIAKLRGTDRTQKGVLVGTVNYMSPEQITGQPVDHRSDVFAVGAVLHELLTYEKAFKGDLTTAMFNIVHGRPEPLVARCPGLDPAFQAVVDRCLAKDPADRYQDLALLKRDLARLRKPLEDDEADAPETLPPLDEDDTVLTPRPPSSQIEAKPGPDTRRAIGSALNAGEAALAGGLLESAMRHAEQALALESDNRTARDLLERVKRAVDAARLRSQLGAAREGLATDRLDDARVALRAAAEVAPDSDTVRDLAAKVEQRAVDLGRFGGALQEARQSLEERDFEQARRLAETALTIRPDDSTVRRLREQIDRAAAEQQQWLNEERRAVDELVAGQEFERALSRLEAARAKAPHVEELTARAAAVGAARDEARRAAEARRREEEERRLAEARRREEEQRQAAEARRREEEERRLAEVRRREEEARQAAEARRREEEARQAAEARRREEQKRREAEAARSARMAELLAAAGDQSEPLSERRRAAAAVLAIDPQHRVARERLAELDDAIAERMRPEALDRTILVRDPRDEAVPAVDEVTVLDVEPTSSRKHPAPTPGAEDETVFFRESANAQSPETQVMRAGGNAGAIGATLPRKRRMRTGSWAFTGASAALVLLMALWLRPTAPATVTNEAETAVEAADPAVADTPPATAPQIAENVREPAPLPTTGAAVEPTPARPAVSPAVPPPDGRPSGAGTPAVPTVPPKRPDAKVPPPPVAPPVTTPTARPDPVSPPQPTVPAASPAASPADSGSRPAPPPAPPPPVPNTATPPPPNVERTPSGTAPATPDVKPAAPSAEEEAAARRRTDESQIRALVARFGQAYANMDLDGIRAVWPDMRSADANSYRNVFRSYRSIGWNTGNVDIELQGTTATVRAGTTVNLRQLRPDTTTTQSRTYRFRAERQARGWVLVGVENLGADR